MALINNQAQAIADQWTYPDADGNIAVRAGAVVPVDVLVGLGNLFDIERPIGAFVSSGITADRIASLLETLDLVAVAFPKFRDGRGFTVARTLREKHGYKGDIRAVGHVLPDQFTALVQCGFSSIVTPPEHPPEQWSVARLPEKTLDERRGPLLHRLVGRGASGGAGR